MIGGWEKIMLKKATRDYSLRIYMRNSPAEFYSNIIHKSKQLSVTNLLYWNQE